jgi:methyltransferase (TIGR00027 family)
MRSLGGLLPDGERLVVDPYGERFAWPWARRTGALAASSPLARHALFALRPLRWNVHSLALRTRALDEAVHAFHAAGGRQVLLLGAGFDCRAARLGLGELTFFEVDHPATQREKRRVMGSPDNVRYLAWNFEEDPMSGLGARLAELGHDASIPTLTLWEGVTMYLHESAIDASVRAVRALSAPSSVLAFNYIDRSRIEGPLSALKSERLVVGAVGEPFRFGFDPRTLGEWLDARGYRLESDEGYDELARRWLPPKWAKRARADRRIAIARV